MVDWPAMYDSAPKLRGQRPNSEIGMDIGYFLKLMMEKNASDMFLSTGAAASIKVEGKIHALGKSGLPPGMVKKIAYSLMDEAQIAEFEENFELNLAISIKDAGRFRVNVFKQRSEVGMVIRSIKGDIPNFEELHMPMLLRDMIMEKRGIVLVVGSTGSGKSTTLASMIDYRNSNSAGHILTIEDPIEFLHRHKKSIVNQREVGIDTHTYRNALKAALREAPDVLLIGEILDIETMEAAIAFAETGHLVLATLHSNNADQTMDRILNFFPEVAHKQILQSLSLNLKGIISQRLVMTKAGKRRAAVEILVNTPLIRDMIRRGEIAEMKQKMDESLDAGMQTFDQALYKLYKDGICDLEEVLKNADSRDGLDLKIKLSEGASSDDDADMMFDPSTF